MPTSKQVSIKNPKSVKSHKSAISPKAKLSPSTADKSSKKVSSTSPHSEVPKNHLQTRTNRFNPLNSRPLTIPELRKKGYSIDLTNRTVACTEFSSRKPFFLYWKRNGALERALPMGDGSFRFVFGCCHLQDTFPIQFHVLTEAELVAANLKI